MNEIAEPPTREFRCPVHEPSVLHEPSVHRVSAQPAMARPRVRRRWAGRLFGVGVLLTLAGALGIGGWRYYSQHRQVLATAQQAEDFVPSLRVATVRASDPNRVVTLPATTLAFTAANIYARASGYIVERKVDIGDRVKQGQLLAQITAPELDHQIAQNQATLAQNTAAVKQAEANMELARVTWQRNSTLVKQGWVTLQQGDTDRLNLQAQQASVDAAKQFVAAQEGLLSVLRQQKSYQSVVAPFDGVVTQRNINVGDLVQADAASGTFMFTVQQSDVIRTQVYVPQDQAFGVTPGVEAVVHVPELPDRTFPGKVTRIADALQPGTRTLLAEIDIPNPDGALTPGLYCTIELHVPRKTPSLVVPAEAIIFNRGGLQVAVMEDGVARIRKVSVARDLGTQVEVRDGIKPGDRVILNPPVELADGSKVQARPEPPTKQARQ
jgi:RND family efflux transporter MFP subunit